MASSIFGDNKNWATWKGIEKEGRLIGSPSLFIRDMPISLGAVSQVRHLYFHESFLATHGYDLPRKFASTHLITLETSAASLRSIPDDLREICHLMYKVDAGDLELLKSDDTIRLDSPDSVATVTKRILRYTYQKEYKDDRPVTFIS